MRTSFRSPARLAVASLVAVTGVAAATPAELTAAPTFWGELLAILLPLAFIIVALLVALRHIRRKFGLTGQDAPLSVVQILPVGPRERVVLVRSRAGRVLAVGVSGHSVNLITELDAADIAPLEGAPVVEAVPGKRTFLDLMRRPQGPTAR